MRAAGPPVAPPGIDFRRLEPSDIQAGLGLCRASGWNQTADDWQLLLDIGAEGCLAAVADTTLVGTATTVNYEDRFAWIGMVLVDPAARGRGIGSSLLEAAIARLGGVPARLDATPQGYPLYVRLGFEEEYRLERMTSTTRSAIDARAAEGTRRLRESELETVAAWDREVFGADRRRVLARALELAPERAFVVEEDGTMAGYCFGRPGRLFGQIGPVVANSVEAASRLVAACCLAAPGAPLVIDVPLVEGWPARLAGFGFTGQRPFVRMCRGLNAHPGRPDRQLAIFGPEWG